MKNTFALITFICISTFAQGQLCQINYLYDVYGNMTKRSYDCSGKIAPSNTEDLTLDETVMIDEEKDFPDQNNAEDQKLEDLEGVISFMIYPNPTQDVLTIRSNSSLNRNHLLYNTSDKLLISLASSEPENQIDLSSLPSGIYILKVIDYKGGLLFKKQIIKI